MGAAEISRDCAKHGAYPATLIHKSDKGEIWTPCPTCRKEEQWEREDAEFREQEKLRIPKQLAAARIPSRFLGRAHSLETFRADTKGRQDALRDAKRFLFDPDNEPPVVNLILSGRPGTGKSHLACAILVEFIRREFGGPGLYLTQRNLIREIRATWDEGARETEAQVLRRLIKIDLLVVDEVGTGLGSEAERAQFFEIIDGRYCEQLPTILITNLDRKHLAEYVGERCMDRLREEGLWIPFNWASSRGDTSL